MKKINNTFLDRSSLVGEWLLDGNANDTAGTNNGTATNVTWASASRGYVEEVGSFNGSSSQITFGDIFNLADYTDLTIAMYINIDNFSTRDTICGNYTGGQGGWDLNKNTDNKIYFQTYNTSGSTQTSIVSNEALVAGQYYLILFGREGSDIFLQIHGGVEVSGAATIFNNTTSVFYIGTHPQVYGPCAMDAGLIKGYDKKISQQEINSLYQEGLRQFGPTQSTTTIPVSGLVASYDADNITLDTSGNGNDGTATSVITQKVGQQNVGVYNGSSSKFDTNYNILGADSSVSFDYKHTIAGTNDYLLSQGYKVVGTISGRLGFQVKTDNNILMFQNPGGVVTETTTTPLVVGETYHFVWRRTGTTLWELFIDGVLTLSSNGGIAMPNESLVLASLPVSNVYQAGQIGLPRIYNRALTQAEIDTLNHEAKTKLSFPNYSLHSLEVGKVLEISKPQSGGIYYDQTGNGNNGTPTSVVDSENGLNNVMSFNGTSSGIDATITTGVNFSISLSFKATNISLTARLFARGTFGNDLAIQVFQSKVRGLIGQDGSGLVIGTQSATLISGKTYRYILSYDGANLKQYLDGVLITNDATTATLGTGAILSSFGYDTNENKEYFGGDISNPDIYNRALSDTEIQQDYYSSKLI